MGSQRRTLSGLVKGRFMDAAARAPGAEFGFDAAENEPFNVFLYFLIPRVWNMMVYESNT